MGAGERPPNKRIVALVDKGHAAARFGQDRAERELADAVHRVDDHLETGIADRLQVDQLFHGVHICVGEVAPLDDAGVQRDVEFQLDDVVRGEPVGLVLDLARFVVEQQRAIAVEDFEAVPLRRIVAGGESQPVGRTANGRGVGDQRSGRVLVQQNGGDVVAGENFGRGFGGLPREEAAIVADDDAAAFPAPAAVISLASAWLRRRTLCMVKPSPMMARQPPVPKVTRFCSSWRRGRKSRFCTMNSARARSSARS